MFLSITQQSLDLQICLFMLFHSDVYANKKVFKIKGYKIMKKGSYCDRNSQFSEILTEPLNPNKFRKKVYSIKKLNKRNKKKIKIIKKF